MENIDLKQKIKFNEMSYQNKKNSFQKLVVIEINGVCSNSILNQVAFDLFWSVEKSIV